MITVGALKAAGDCELPDHVATVIPYDAKPERYEAVHLMQSANPVAPRVLSGQMWCD